VWNPLSAYFAEDENLIANQRKDDESPRRIADELTDDAQKLGQYVVTPLLNHSAACGFLHLPIRRPTAEQKAFYLTPWMGRTIHRPDEPVRTSMRHGHGSASIASTSTLPSLGRVILLTTFVESTTNVYSYTLNFPACSVHMDVSR
jgi:hypothetical protein